MSEVEWDVGVRGGGMQRRGLRERGMGRRALCSANGSCAFPWSGWPRLLLTTVPLHCNYLQWRDRFGREGPAK